MAYGQCTCAVLIPIDYSAICIQQSRLKAVLAFTLISNTTQSLSRISLSRAVGSVDGSALSKFAPETSTRAASARASARWLPTRPTVLHCAPLCSDLTDLCFFDRSVPATGVPRGLRGGSGEAGRHAPFLRERERESERASERERERGSQRERECG